MPIKRSSKEDKNYVEDKFLKLEKIVEDIVLSRTPHDHQILYKRRMVFDNVIGTYPVIGQSQKDRPRVKFRHIENLYLVGDAVNAPGIGGSSNTAFSSALLCAEDIKKNISRN